MATIDRATAKMIAYKRIINGCISIACGIALVIACAVHGKPPPAAALAFVLFFGGGAWTLRDGIRLRRELLGGR